MKKIAKRLLYLLPTAICMVVIFLFSAKTGAQSGGSSGRVVKYIMELVIPGVDGWEEARRAEVAHVLEVIIRKVAHATEFALLEISLVFGLAKGDFVKTIKNIIFISIIIASLYACSDEIHQLFVPGRSGQITDVIIDVLGILVAAVVCKWNVRKNNKSF